MGGKSRNKKKNASNSTNPTNSTNPNSQVSIPANSEVTSSVPSKPTIDLNSLIAGAQELKLKGNKLFGEKEFASALKTYDSALEMMPKEHPDCALLYSNKAACLLQMKPTRYNDVIQECNSALSLNPKFVRALLRRARSYEALGNYKAAEVDIQAIKNIEPYNSDVLELEKKVKAHQASFSVKKKDESNGSLKSSSSTSSPSLSSISSSPSPSPPPAVAASSPSLSIPLVSAVPPPPLISQSSHSSSSSTPSPSMNRSSSSTSSPSSFASLHSSQLNTTSSSKSSFPPSQKSSLLSSSSNLMDSSSTTTTSSTLSSSSSSSSSSHSNSIAAAAENGKETSSLEKKFDSKSNALSLDQPSEKSNSSLSAENSATTSSKVLPVCVNKDSSKNDKTQNDVRDFTVDPKMVKIKFVYDGHDTRKSEIPLKCTFEQLREIAMKRFSHLTSFLIKYEDEEGDLITITCKEDIGNAINVSVYKNQNSENLIPSVNLKNPLLKSASEMINFSQQAIYSAQRAILAARNQINSAQSFKTGSDLESTTQEPDISKNNDSLIEGSKITSVENMFVDPSKSYLKLYIFDVEMDKEPPIPDDDFFEPEVNKDLAIENKPIDDGDKADENDEGAEDGKEEKDQSMQEDHIMIDNWVLEFAALFREKTGISPFAQLELQDLSQGVLNKIMDETINSEKAAEIFDLAAVKFSEMASVVYVNWGNVFLWMGKRQVSSLTNSFTSDEASSENPEITKSKRKIEIIHEGENENKTVIEFVIDDDEKDEELSSEEKKKRIDLCEKIRTSYDKAKLKFEEALLIHPSSPDATASLAQCYHDLARLEEKTFVLKFGNNNFKSKDNKSILSISQNYALSEKNFSTVIDILQELEIQHTQQANLNQKNQDSISTLESEDNDLTKDENFMSEIANYRINIYFQWAQMQFYFSQFLYKLGDSKWKKILSDAKSNYEKIGISKNEVEKIVHFHLSTRENLSAAEDSSGNSRIVMRDTTYGDSKEVSSHFRVQKMEIDEEQSSHQKSNHTDHKAVDSNDPNNLNLDSQTHQNATNHSDLFNSETIKRASELEKLGSGKKTRGTKSENIQKSVK